MIVVLEDDPRVRGALCLLLSDWDFRTTDGVSAGEALQKLGAETAAVTAVITDFDLGPGINGVDEARALRGAGVAAPVLVISGSLRGRAGEMAREAGFHFLSKPVNPADLQTWLASRGG